MHPTPTTSTPALRPGERIGGIVLNEAGDYQHHLVLLPARTEAALTWQAAKDWAASVGGELPTPQEQSLLFAHCKDHLPNAWCWSNKEAADTSYGWYCVFDYGHQGNLHKSFEGSAVAVRRLILESFNSFGGTAAPGATREPATLTRDDFAMKAMDHMAWRQDNTDTCAALCYVVADAMLNAREGSAA